MKITVPFLRSPFNYDRNEASDETAISTPEADRRTQQHQSDEADINLIVKRFGVTGQLPIRNQLPPLTEDFTEVFDFHSAQQLIREATEAFNALPADVRLRFSNDPGAFVDFSSDPDNLPELRKMGLAAPEIVPEPTPPAPAPTPPAPPGPSP